MPFHVASRPSTTPGRKNGYFTLVCCWLKPLCKIYLSFRKHVLPVKFSKCCPYLSARTNYHSNTFVYLSLQFCAQQKSQKQRTSFKGVQLLAPRSSDSWTAGGASRLTFFLFISWDRLSEVSQRLLNTQSSFCTQPRIQRIQSKVK